jgi:serine protease Do
MLPPRPGSNAAIAGLQSGDLIIEADGRQIESYGILYEVFDGHESGDSIELRVRRNSSELTDISVVR